MNIDNVNALMKMLNKSSHVVIVQADNPDADSIGSAVALEEILASLGKTTTLYCGVDMPQYLHYINGWSRVENRLPSVFDTTVVVDASTTSLLEKITLDPNYGTYLSSRKIILDHHASTDNTINADIKINDTDTSSTSELIYDLSRKCDWILSDFAREAIIAGILGDTQGLSNNLARPSTYRAIADLLERGSDRAAIEEKRRSYNKLHRKVYAFKAALISRTELHYDDHIACVEVNQEEINEFSPLYNPAALIQPDMLQIEGVELSIVFKVYSDGKTTAAIRSNYSSPIAGELARRLGGGGHEYASGFKINDGRSFNDIKNNCLLEAGELLAALHGGQL